MNTIIVKGGVTVFDPVNIFIKQHAKTMRLVEVIPKNKHTGSSADLEIIVEYENETDLYKMGVAVGKWKEKNSYNYFGQVEMFIRKWVQYVSPDNREKFYGKRNFPQYKGL